MKIKIFVLLFVLVLMGGKGFSQNWHPTFADALKSAQSEQKSIVLVFSGSDWCAPCIKLDQKVWQAAEFQQLAEKVFVLYRADFPKSKKNQLPDNLKTENGALAEKYNKQGYFPYVLVLDSDGKVLGSVGYKDLSPKAYFDLLYSFVTPAK